MRLSIPNKEKESNVSVRNKIVSNRVELVNNENNKNKVDEKYQKIEEIVDTKKRRGRPPKKK